MKKMMLRIVCSSFFLSSSIFANCINDNTLSHEIADMADFSTCTDVELDICKEALIRYSQAMAESSKTAQTSIAQSTYNAILAKAKITLLLVKDEIKERKRPL